jgi:hypothetical protein
MGALALSMKLLSVFRYIDGQTFERGEQKETMKGVESKKTLWM